MEAAKAAAEPKEAAALAAARARADWAKEADRKSTSGGMVMCGKHAVKHWASTQSLISLSSGEAEYYGHVRAGLHAWGVKSMLADL